MADVTDTNFGPKLRSRKEGAAVAQISWQFAVPCLIVRSISDTASGSSLVDYYKFVKIAARNSSGFVAETITQLKKLGPALPKPPASAISTPSPLPMPAWSA